MGGEIFRIFPGWPWGLPSLLYNGYRFFPGGKVRPGRAADHSPPSSAAVMEEQSYTSTHSLSHTGPVTGLLYFTFNTTGMSDLKFVESKYIVFEVVRRRRVTY